MDFILPTVLKRARYIRHIMYIEATREPGQTELNFYVMTFFLACFLVSSLFTALISRKKFSCIHSVGYLFCLFHCDIDKHEIEIIYVQRCFVNKFFAGL